MIVYSFRKKEFEIIHFTRAALDVLSKREELNSELHCRVYCCLFKNKMIKTEIYEKC